MSTRDQILANIKPDEYISPNALAKRIGNGMKVTNLSYHLRAMLKDKTLTAIGATTGRQYAIADAPPQQPSTKKQTKKPAKKHAAKPPRKTKKTKPASRSPGSPPPAAQVDSTFIPAMTFDNRLVIIGRDPAPQIFTPEHTQDIATLLLDRFDPA